MWMMILTIWSGWARKTKTKQTTTVCFVAPRWCSSIWNERGVGKIVRHSCFIQTEMKRSGSYLVVSTPTLGPVHLKRVQRGGWGAGGEVTSSMRHVRLLVWPSVHGFVCWSSPEAILFIQSFHLLLDPLDSASHTVRSVSAGTWYWRLYFSPVLGKHLPVKTSICRSSGGSVNVTNTVILIEVSKLSSKPHCENWNDVSGHCVLFISFSDWSIIPTATGRWSRSTPTKMPFEKFTICAMSQRILAEVINVQQ